MSSQAGKYLEAAKQFSQALDLIGSTAQESTHRSGLPISYFLKMEQANCLVLSGEFSRLPLAIPLYEEVLKSHPTDATVHLRLSRALRAQLINESDQTKRQSVLTRACELLSKGIPLVVSDGLTGPSHWLNLSMRIQLGFNHWELSELYRHANRTDERLLELNDAIIVTACAYRYWSRIEDEKIRESSTHKPLAHKGISNALYYCAQITKGRPTKDPKDVKRLKTFVNIYKSIRLSPKEHYREFFKTRDNLMYAYAAMGDNDTAANLAMENYAELRDYAETLSGHPLLSNEIEPALIALRGEKSPELLNFLSAKAFLMGIGRWT